MLSKYLSLKNIVIILFSCMRSFFSNRSKDRLAYVTVLSIVGVTLPLIYALLFQLILGFFMGDPRSLIPEEFSLIASTEISVLFSGLILLGIILITLEYIFQRKMLLENIHWQINNQIENSTDSGTKNKSLIKSNKSAFLIGRLLTNGTKDFATICILLIIITYFDYKLSLFMLLALVMLVPFLFTSISKSISEKKSKDSLFLSGNLNKLLIETTVTDSEKLKLEKDLLNITRNNRQYIGVIQSYFVSNLLVIISVFIIFLYLHSWNVTESGTKFFVIILAIFYFRAASSLTKLLARILRNWESIKSLSQILSNKNKIKMAKNDSLN